MPYYSYDFWFDTIKGTEMQLLDLGLLVQHNQGDGVAIQISFEGPGHYSASLTDHEANCPRFASGTTRLIKLSLTLLCKCHVTWQQKQIT